MECQQCTRDPAYVLREKCFIALKGVIETKRNKLISQSINGIYVSTHNICYNPGLHPEYHTLLVFHLKYYSQHMYINIKTLPQICS